MRNSLNIHRTYPPVLFPAIHPHALDMEKRREPLVDAEQLLDNILNARSQLVLVK